jgi:ABC-type phosphonate transport system ATPase subunit
MLEICRSKRQKVTFAMHSVRLAKYRRSALLLIEKRIDRVVSHSLKCQTRKRPSRQSPVSTKQRLQIAKSRATKRESVKIDHPEAEADTVVAVVVDAAVAAAVDAAAAVAVTNRVAAVAAAAADVAVATKRLFFMKKPRSFTK